MPKTSPPLRSETALGSIKKRSITVNGGKSSVALEDEFWLAFIAVANIRGFSLGELATEINASRSIYNLSSAIRVFILQEALAGRISANSLTEIDIRSRGRRPGTR